MNLRDFLYFPKPQGLNARGNRLWNKWKKSGYVTYYNKNANLREEYISIINVHLLDQLNYSHFDQPGLVSIDILNFKSRAFLFEGLADWELEELIEKLDSHPIEEKILCTLIISLMNMQSSIDNIEESISNIERKFNF